MMGFTKKAGTAMIRVSTSTGSQVLRLLLRGCAVASTDISACSCFVGRDSSAPPASTNTLTITVVGKRVPEPYASFLTLCAYLLKGCRASIHPVSDKRGSRTLTHKKSRGGWIPAPRPPTVLRLVLTLYY